MTAHLDMSDQLGEQEGLPRKAYRRLVAVAHAKDPRDADCARRGDALLDRLLAVAEEGDRAGSVIEILVLPAHAHHARGDLGAATSTLGRAVDCAEPEGYVRVLVDTEPLANSACKTHSLRPRTVAGRITTRNHHMW
ncbi:MAG: ATP-dependent transcriptional regulator [Acidimicrobiales bacterium]|nr:ATP-dependent transcriptional regulator [Acidimicrobiales bacterium]